MNSSVATSFIAYEPLFSLTNESVADLNVVEVDFLIYLFLAPTKPLTNQHYRFLKNSLNIDEENNNNI